MEKIIYNELTQMAFVRNKENNLEPIMYEAYIKDKKIFGKQVQKNSIYHMFIKYVRHSSEETDKQTGDPIPGFLEIYQWKKAFEIIKNAVELRSNDIIIAISRQAKITGLRIL